MSQLSRRGLLGIGASYALGSLIGVRLGLPSLWAARPIRPVSGPALELVERSFEGIARDKMWDTHVHLVGMGTGDSGCWVNPSLRSVLAPVKRLRYDVFRAASGVTDDERADQQYLERLLRLHRTANPLGKLVMLAFDYRVREDGSEDPARSDFFTPNEYVLAVAKENPDVVACASVHPYRVDALDRLARAASEGARAVKWLPNAMGIDPLSEKCDAFYAKLVELGLPLITHCGEEQAVDSGQDQELGNPLRLRRALERGVRIVVAHCASLGRVEDLDAGDGSRIDAFDAFMRLFTDRRFEKNLFADISAVLQFNRLGRPLRELLLSKDLHARLVNGSDYPLPAIDPMISTRALVDAGYLTPAERELTNAIFEANPLLFDFVVKRSVKVEYRSAVHTFSPGVFETSWLFGGPPRGG